jgi:hypothetical protein
MGTAVIDNVVTNADGSYSYTWSVTDQNGQVTQGSTVCNEGVCGDYEQGGTAPSTLYEDKRGQAPAEGTHDVQLSPNQNSSSESDSEDSQGDSDSDGDSEEDDSSEDSDDSSEDDSDDSSDDDSDDSSDDSDDDSSSDSETDSSDAEESESLVGDHPIERGSPSAAQLFTLVLRERSPVVDPMGGENGSSAIDLTNRLHSPVVDPHGEPNQSRASRDLTQRLHSPVVDPADPGAGNGAGGGVDPSDLIGRPNPVATGSATTLAGGDPMGSAVDLMTLAGTNALAGTLGGGASMGGSPTGNDQCWTCPWQFIQTAQDCYYYCPFSHHPVTGLPLAQVLTCQEVEAAMADQAREPSALDPGGPLNGGGC